MRGCRSEVADFHLLQQRVCVPNASRCPIASASLGFIVWLALCFAPLDPQLGVGLIEKLFLLSPLALIPLSLAVVKPDNSWLHMASDLQPLGAAGIAVCYFFPCGVLSGVFTMLWLGVAVVGAFGAVVHVIRGAYRNPTESAFAVALLGLPIGAFGFFQSRMGMEPLGFREPLVLLVAVHFHYAAVIPLIFAGALGRLRRIASWRENKLFSVATILLALGSPILASGYVFRVPLFRLGGAALLTVGLLIWSVMMLWSLPKVHSRFAQLLLAIPAVSILAGMTFAMIYAVADYYGEVWLAIPYMARTHGVINALAFSLCGLIGWCVALKQFAPLLTEKAHQRGRLSPLTRRWNQ